jgi:hypothetical protein
MVLLPCFAISPQVLPTDFYKLRPSAFLNFSSQSTMPSAALPVLCAARENLGSEFSWN